MPQHPIPTDFTSLIDMFGGVRPMAELLAEARVDVKPRTLYAWRGNNWIPARWWREIARVAKANGFEGISYALLAGFPRPDVDDPESEF